MCLCAPAHLLLCQREGCHFNKNGEEDDGETVRVRYMGLNQNSVQCLQKKRTG